jgi:membrane protein DedA with SNARE-associated domain
VNLLAALAWAVGLGLGSYYAGPPVLDVVEDMGWVTFAALVALILVVVGGGLLTRRRGRRRRSEIQASD